MTVVLAAPIAAQPASSLLYLQSPPPHPEPAAAAAAAVGPSASFPGPDPSARVVIKVCVLYVVVGVRVGVYACMYVYANPSCYTPTIHLTPHPFALKRR